MSDLATLLKNVTDSKAAFATAQENYDAAKTALESSPLLAEHGLQLIGDAKEKKAIRTRGPRKSYPEVTLDGVVTIVKGKGKDGCVAGELAAHFGPNFAKWRKANEKDIAKNFAIAQDGTSRIWTTKSAK